MLKIGQNWGKITNYPPQCSTKIGTAVDPAIFQSLTRRSANVTQFCVINVQNFKVRATKTQYWKLLNLKVFEVRSVKVLKV